MAGVSKGLITYVVMVVIVIIVWYLSTGFRLPGGQSSTTTTTISGPSTSSVSTTTIMYIYPCSNFDELTQANNTTVTDECNASSGYLGLWVASGNFQYEKVLIKGLSDNRTYINQTANYSCTTFYANFSVSNQIYSVSLTTGPLASNVLTSCTLARAKLNTTLFPPPTIYNNVYNGNFMDGEYTGWSLYGKGFGTAPINITKANENTTSQCYVGQPWTGYIGSYIATTYNCGLSNAPGNITSSLFYANQPFLNFKIISPQDNFLYVEILYNNTPYIIAHYNTYNISSGSTCNVISPSPNSTGSNSSACASTTFRNASIPLVTVIDKPIQVRVVADTLNRQTYIAAGDFALGAKPKQDQGILYGPYNFTH